MHTGHERMNIAWVEMASKSDKNGDDESSGSGNEVQAEWIVKAQLKITQPKKKAASFGTGDCGAHRSTGSPCRVVYKWNSDTKSQDRSTSATRRNVKNSSQKVSFSILAHVIARTIKQILDLLGKWIKTAYELAEQ